MIPRADLLSDGSLRLCDLPPWFVLALAEVPRILSAPRTDAVNGRLFPYPTDDEEAREEWRRLVHPELFASLASAQEIVATDLRGLRSAESGWQIDIPETNRSAWIAALNAARLTLAERFGITEEDMERDAVAEEDGKLHALGRIHVLAHLQLLIIEA